MAIGETEMDDTRQLIEDLRGGVPDRCSFCGQEAAPGELEPEEAGCWICRSCLEKQEYNDVLSSPDW